MSQDKLNIQDVVNKYKEQSKPELDTKKESILGNLPEGFDKSKIENSYSGVEVSTNDVMNEAPVAGGGISGGNGKLSKDQMASIQETLAEMDAEADAARAEFENWNKLQKQQREEGKEPVKFEQFVDPENHTIQKVEDVKNAVQEETPDPVAQKAAEEALVVIDKSGMGQVINFTAEERAKLEKVKKIKVQEVEQINLKSLKTKRAKKEDAETVLKRVSNIRTTNIVLPISGITAVMQGCSTFELIGLVSERDVTVQGTIDKWSLIHSKVETTSIGKLDFNTFLNSVSQLEYDIFVYGILCATYPEDDVFPLECPKCNRDFDHKYVIRGMLQTDMMSPRLVEAVKKAVDNSYTVESSKKCFDDSLLNTSFVYELPESGYVVKLGVATAYSHIYESMATIDQLDKKYAQAAILSSTVEAVLVKDPTDGEYFEFTEPIDIIKALHQLKPIDLGILGNKISEMIDGMSFTFGLNNIRCTNPKCQAQIDFEEVSLDSILFHKYHQAINTTIE